MAVIDDLNDRVRRGGKAFAIESIQASFRRGEGGTIADDRRRIGVLEKREPEGRKRYWTLTRLGTCVECGRVIQVRDRVYDTPPPAERNARIGALQPSECYCGCLDGP